MGKEHGYIADTVFVYFILDGEFNGLGYHQVGDFQMGSIVSANLGYPAQLDAEKVTVLILRFYIIGFHHGGLVRI